MSENNSIALIDKTSVKEVKGKEVNNLMEK